MKKKTERKLYRNELSCAVKLHVACSELQTLHVLAILTLTFQHTPSSQAMSKNKNKTKNVHPCKYEAKNIRKKNPGGLENLKTRPDDPANLN